MDTKDLRHLCDVHMEVLKGELDKVKTKIEPGHVVFTFIAPLYLKCNVVSKGNTCYRIFI